jgi:hypothetical protein
MPLCVIFFTILLAISSVVVDAADCSQSGTVITNCAACLQRTGCGFCFASPTGPLPQFCLAADSPIRSNCRPFSTTCPAEPSTDTQMADTSASTHTDTNTPATTSTPVKPVLPETSLVVSSPSPNGLTVKVCGNYCGPCRWNSQNTTPKKYIITLRCRSPLPAWCSRTEIDETLCVQRRIWGGPSDGSCVDECCKLHDQCCGGGNRATCNRAIVNCLTPCGHAVCADAVWAAMKFLQNYCCGAPCPVSIIQLIESTLNRTITPDMLQQAPPVATKANWVYAFCDTKLTPLAFCWTFYDLNQKCEQNSGSAQFHDFQSTSANLHMRNKACIYFYADSACQTLVFTDCLVDNGGHPVQVVKGGQRLQWAIYFDSAHSRSAPESDLPMAVNNWSCDRTYMNSGDGCDCGCGEYDSDCDFNTTTFGCASQGVCNRSGVCSTTAVDAWKCPASKYNDSVACDCDCGAADPDCKVDGAVACSFAVRTQLLISVTIMSLSVYFC